MKLLLDSTLEPVLDAAEARNAADPAAEILKLSIIDPACGSGHFLLGAARRAAARIAKHRSPGAPSQDEFQHALREVVSHCIYGVDRNPMAVELCKVALWIEALEPGKPLTFLDSRIRCGDSLIGVFDYETLKLGITDEAYKPLTGDNKETARAYAKFNKQQRDGKGATGFLATLKPPADLIDAARALADMPEDTLEQVAAKKTSFEKLHSGQNWLNLKIACDCYVAAFFVEKIGGIPNPAALARPTIPLTDHVWTAARGQPIYPPLVGITDKIANSVSAFHWPIEFPHVFSHGGFDAVIGNPPWERIKLQEEEFFAARSPKIAAAQNKAARDRLIKALGKAEPESADARLLSEFQFAKHSAEAASEFVRNSGRYPLTGRGDVNTYAVFAEHFLNLSNAVGRAGILVPIGIATNETSSTFFGALIAEERLAALLAFDEIKRWFAGTKDNQSFCILSTARFSLRPKFVFQARDPADVADPERMFTLSPNQIVRLNPNTKTAPVFRSRADAELTAKIYERVPVLIEEKPAEQGAEINPWGITFQRMFDMSGDSDLFATQRQLEDEAWVREGADWVRSTLGVKERRVPLYEAKMIHHFDHRFGYYPDSTADDTRALPRPSILQKQNPNYEVTPRYWLPHSEVALRSARVPAALKRSVREKIATTA